MELDTHLRSVARLNTFVRSDSDGDLVLKLALLAGKSLGPGETRKRYGLLCHELVPLIRRSGLLKTLGWLHGQAMKDGHDPGEASAPRLLVAGFCLCLWLDRESLGSGERKFRLNQGSGAEDVIGEVLGWLRESDVLECIRSTRRGLELGEWFKAHAETVLDVERHSKIEVE